MPLLDDVAPHTFHRPSRAATVHDDAPPVHATDTDLSHSGDLVLVEAVLQGREDAFVVLVERYQMTLLRIARTYVRDDALAEDVVQDTWIGFLRGVHRFEGRSSFRTWLFRVLSNRARTRAVREARYVPMDDTSETPPHDQRFTETGAWRVPPREWRVTPERLALSGEVRQIVNDALATLPPMQRAVVELRDIQGLDAADACETLAISAANQRVLLHRGRSRVRAALEARLQMP